jgi:hypothetical protein
MGTTYLAHPPRTSRPAASVLVSGRDLAKRRRIGGATSPDGGGSCKASWPGIAMPGGSRRCYIRGVTSRATVGDTRQMRLPPRKRG